MAPRGSKTSLVQSSENIVGSLRNEGSQVQQLLKNLVKKSKIQSRLPGVEAQFRESWVQGDPSQFFFRTILRTSGTQEHFAHFWDSARIATNSPALSVQINCRYSPKVRYLYSIGVIEMGASNDPENKEIHPKTIQSSSPEAPKPCLEAPRSTKMLWKSQEVAPRAIFSAEKCSNPIGPSLFVRFRSAFGLHFG